MLKSGISTFFVLIAIVTPMVRVIRPSPCRTVVRIFSGRRLPSTVPSRPPSDNRADVDQGSGDHELLSAAACSLHEPRSRRQAAVADLRQKA